MSVVDRIIKHFDGEEGRGGHAKFQRAMGHEYASTVQGWKERGVIPMAQIPDVIAVCAKHGLALDYSDFFSGTSEPSTEDEAAA